MRHVLPLSLVLCTSRLALGQAPIASRPEGSSNEKHENIVVLNKEDTEVDLNTVSLEDLLNGTVTVVTRTATKELESSAIVTVVTREDILNSGARDLLDVFQLIPGINLAQDSYGAVSISVRGIWAQEGKVLFLWNGIEINDRGYGIHEFGNRFPLDDIQRIEVLRGPGSVTYGQFAELAVINVITRTPRELNGATVNAYYGQGEHGLGQLDLGASVGLTTKPGIAIDLSAFAGHGERSDRPYTDFAGGSYAMSHNSALNPLFVSAGVQYKDLKLRLIYDGFDMQTRDVSGPVNPAAYKQTLTGYYAQAQYDWHLTDQLTVTPTLSFKSQEPFDIPDPTSPYYFNVVIRHYAGKVMATWNPTESLHLIAGAEVYLDDGLVREPTNVGNNLLWPNGTTRSHLTDEAGFAEATYASIIGNLTVGVRYEHQSPAGTANGTLGFDVPFIPSAALTKTIGRFHYKLLASEAFRAPTLENLAFASGPLIPERTLVFEGEAGYQLTDIHYLAINFFDIDIKQPLSYVVDPTTGLQDYTNSAQPLASYGGELVYRMKYKANTINFSYSFYTTHGLKEAPYYTGSQQAQVNGNVFLGAPAHKFAVLANIAITDSLSIAPSGTLMSSRYGFLSADSSGNPVYGASGTTLLLNAFLRYRDMGGLKGLEGGLGVYNLLGQNYAYVQAFASGHPPLPAMGREYVARLSYHLPF